MRSRDLRRLEVVQAKVYVGLSPSTMEAMGVKGFEHHWKCVQLPKESMGDGGALAAFGGAASSVGSVGAKFEAAATRNTCDVLNTQIPAAAKTGMDVDTGMAVDNAENSLMVEVAEDMHEDAAMGAAERCTSTVCENVEQNFSGSLLPNKGPSEFRAMLPVRRDEDGEASTQPT